MNGDTLDRIEKILEEMAARRQAHNEVMERLDAQIKASRQDRAKIRELLRIAEMRERRLFAPEGDATT